MNAGRCVRHLQRYAGCYAGDKMSEKLKQLRVLALAAGCGAVVLSALLCGYEAHADNDADSDAAAKNDNVDRDTAGETKPSGSHHENDRHEKFIAAAKKTIAIKPDSHRAYFNLGLAYGKLGQYADAITAWSVFAALRRDEFCPTRRCGRNTIARRSRSPLWPGR